MCHVIVASFCKILSLSPQKRQHTLYEEEEEEEEEERERDIWYRERERENEIKATFTFAQTHACTSRFTS